jgi:hypothetical protein
MLHRRGPVDYVRSGSTAFNEDFFSLPEELAVASIRTQHTVSRSIVHDERTPDDVIVLSPGCLIFDDLARCFDRLGLRSRRVSIPETPAQWTDRRRQALVRLLRSRPARRILGRNRTAEEACPLVDWAAILPTPITSWWWDVPNAASMLDQTDARASRPAYVFAKELLALAPEGSQWLPAAARLTFTDASLDDCMNVPRDPMVTFVGQSRLGLLRENLNILINGLHHFFGQWAAKLGDEVNRAGDVPGIYRLLERLHLEIAGKIGSLRSAAPPAAYYLGYLLEMCLTGAYRIAAVQSLTGFPLLVFGDDDWRHLLPTAEKQFCGALPPEHLLELYLRSTVNLNVSFMQVSSGVHPKVLDAAACGGAVLTDDRPELDDLFPSDLRPTSFRSLEELADRASDMLKIDSPDQRRGRALHVRAHHSLEARARRLAVEWGLLDAAAGGSSS